MNKSLNRGALGALLLLLLAMVPTSSAPRFFIHGGGGGAPPSCTLSAVNLSNNSFAGGSSSGTVVGAITVTTSGTCGNPTISITGTDAASFQLSATNPPSNLETSGVVASGSYSINLVATLAGAIGSPLTQPETITGTGGLVEIGSGITLLNNGSTGSNVPTRFGFGFARGDMPLGNTLVVKDDAGNTLTAQIDQLSTRSGMPGSTDTAGWLHAVISVIEPSWTASATHTFHVYRTSGSYTPGSGLATSALTGAHDYQVLFNNVEDGGGNVIGSGNFTCDLNTAIASGARTAAGGYDITYNGSVQTTIEALQPCIDNVSGSADAQLTAEFYAVLWQTTPGAGTLGNVELAANLSQPWQNVSSFKGTGSIAATTLTLTAISSGVVTVGAQIEKGGANAVAQGTVITNVGTCGGVSPTLPCTATVNNSQTVALEALTGGPRFVWGDAEIFDATTSTVLRSFSSTTSFAPSNVTVSPAGSYSIGTITNTDSIQFGESITFSTSTGTLPTGITAGFPYFALETVGAGNVPGAVSVSRNGGIYTAASSVADYVNLTSQGTCPSGSCLSITRHAGIDQFSGTWLFADDKAHPFWVGSNVAQLVPDLTTAQQTYWETTALVPAFVVSSFASAPPSPWPVFAGAGGPLYRSHSLGPQESNIDGAGNHMGLGEWGNVAAVWWMTQSVANWDILHALALTQSNAVLHHVLNNVTGYIGAYDNGPYPSGGSYTKIGAAMPLALNIGPNPSNSLYYNLFSLPAVPAGISNVTAFNYGPFGGALTGNNSPNSHEPDFGNTASYTIMGEPWYLRSQQMEANFSVLARYPSSAPTLNPANDGLTNRALGPIGGVNYYGLIINGGETPRGPAWALRGIEQAATLGADSDPSKLLMWSYFRENVDGMYAFRHIFWAATDPNLETIGAIDMPLSGDFVNTFMYPYAQGTWAAAQEKTHYASGTLSGASTLYFLNQASILPVALESTWLTTNGSNGQSVCNYWSPAEEGQNSPGVSTTTTAVPGTPTYDTSISTYDVGQSGNGGGWRSAVDTYNGSSNVVTPTQLLSGNDGSKLVENGDVMRAQFIGFPAGVTLFGTNELYVVDAVNGASPSLQLSNTGPLSQACSASTGSSGCPAAVNPIATGAPSAGAIANGGSGYVDGTYNTVALTGGSGTGGFAQSITVSGGVVTSVTPYNPTANLFGSGYKYTDAVSAANTSLGGSGSGFSYQLSAVSVGVDLSSRPQACPAAPATFDNDGATAAGYTAYFKYTYINALNAGTTSPGSTQINTALTNLATRYAPVTPYTATAWGWLVQQVTIP